MKLTSVNVNPDNKRLFENTVKYEYNKMISKEELIFEDLNYNLDTDKLFEEFFMDKEDGYLSFLEEDSSQRVAYVKDYFYNKTIIPIYENFQLHIDKNKIQCIEEGTEYHQTFSDQVKLETTAKFLIENFILDFLPRDKRKEITEDIMMARTLKFHELQESLDNSPTGVVAGVAQGVANGIQTTIDQLVGTVTGTARALKELVLGLVVLFYSPFMVVASENLKYKYLGTSGKGKIKQFMELVGPCQNIGELLFGSYAEVGGILKKVNEIDSTEVKDFLKQVSQDKSIREKIVNDCWMKNAKVPSATEQGKTGLVKFVHMIGNTFQRARMTGIGNPQDAGDGLLGFLFSMDADNPNFQRSFFEFRKCTYDHIFALIRGYAKTAIEVEISNVEILERIKVASKRKDYTVFNTLQQSSDDAEDLMYKVGKVLLSIDELAESLKKNKRLLFQDQYIDQFYMYLKQKIKQSYLDLDEIASKASSKANEKHAVETKGHKDDKYDESWKDHKLSSIRDSVQGKTPKKIKSIYDM